MINFEFCSPTKFVFGRGAEVKVGALVKQFGGTKVLVHFGGGSVKRTGVYGKSLGAFRPLTETDVREILKLAL